MPPLILPIGHFRKNVKYAILRTDKAIYFKQKHFLEDFYVVKKKN